MTTVVYHKTKRDVSSSDVNVISSEEEFSRAISDDFSVIDVFADWCHPCKKVAPEFAKLSYSVPNANFYKVDVGLVPAELQVTALPTFLLCKNGQVVDRYIGADIKRLMVKIENMV
jgi:thiol-disulfide isomerase/thioredoxin